MWWPFSRKKSDLRNLSIDDFLALSGVPNTGSGEYVSAGTAESLPAVMNAVSVIAEAVATMPCYLYLVRNDKGREAREWLDSHPVDILLNEQPNSCLTPYQFKRTMMRHCLLNGNAYAVIEWGRDGQPKSLHPYAPGCVVPERTGTHKYRYTITEPCTGTVRTYLQEEVLHLRYASDDGFLGRSPVTICREALGLGLAQQRHGASIMKDGMMAAGIITSGEWLDGVKGKQALDALERYKGAKNAGKTPILEGGMDYRQLGMSNQDAEWLASRRFSIEDIARMFNVSPIFLQEYSNSTYSNFSEASRAFLTMTMRPWLANFEQQIKAALLVTSPVPGTRYLVEFDSADLLRATPTERYATYEKGIKSGIMNPNEAREREGKATGRRKYTSAFIEVPRKNAKSTVAAILANWFLVMENGQQDIYTAAVSRDQARIVFDDARQMCLLSRPLRKRVNIQAHKVIHPKTNSLLKPLAAKAATIEGTNPSLAIVDEYHLHPDNGVYSALELGMGARPEGLLFAITTSGSNVVSACKQHYDYCCQILDGEEVNESMFVLIYELDDESEVDDPAMWIKANPNIDVSVDREKLASTIQKARGIPSQWVEMLTKRFNIWCQGATPWMGNGAWAECAGTFAEADLYGQECYAGLDLSSTSDISSVCYAFPVGKKIMLVSRHYLPEFQLQNPANKNRAIYRQWVKAGWIRTTPGDCIDYDRIRDDIMADAENFNIRLVGFDTWNATHLRTQLQGAGFEVEPFPQTYLRFSPAAKSFEVFVNRKVIVHRGDPVLAWSMSNVVMQSDANANIKPNKKKSSNKIDPSVAALMAFGTFQAEHEEFAFDMSDSHKERLAAFDGV